MLFALNVLPVCSIGCLSVQGFAEVGKVPCHVFCPIYNFISLS